jgi:hypothetical protein
VPNICQWFEIEGGKMAYHEIDYNDVLGAKDQTFYVVEKRSYDAICYEQNFYKQYASLDIKFILTDDN